MKINYTKDELDRDVFVSLVELAIFNNKRYSLDEIIELLLKKYNATFYEVFEHPEFLQEILYDLYGENSITLIKILNNELQEYFHNKIFFKL